MKLRELFEVAPVALGGKTATGTTLPLSQTAPARVVDPQTRQTAIAAAQEELKAAQEELKADQAAVPDAQEKVRQAQIALSNVRNPTNPVEENTQLKEYSVDFVDNLVTLLRNLIGRADDKKMSSKMSYRALKRMLQKTVGSSVSLDKEIFQELTNSNQQLSKYVTKIGNHGVVLATEVKYKPKKKPTKKTPKTKNKKSGVRGAASRGAKYLAKSRNNP